MAKNNSSVGLREVSAEGKNNPISRFLKRINPFKHNADNEASSQKGIFDYAINQGAVRSSGDSNGNTNPVTHGSDVVARGVDHSKDDKIVAPNLRINNKSDVVARGVDHSKDGKIVAPNLRINNKNVKQLLVPSVDTSATQSQSYATKKAILSDKMRRKKPVAKMRRKKPVAKLKLMPTIDEVSVESDSKGIRRTKDVKTADKDFQSKILGIAKGKVSDKHFDKLKTALENPAHRKEIKDGFAKAEKDKRKRHNGTRIDI